jgi:hypothetical protein
VNKTRKISNRNIKNNFKTKWKLRQYIWNYIWRLHLFGGGILLIIIGFILLGFIGNASAMLISLSIMIIGLFLILIGYKLCRQFQLKYLDGNKIWSLPGIVRYIRKNKIYIACSK